MSWLTKLFGHKPHLQPSPARVTSDNVVPPSVENLKGFDFDASRFRRICLDGGKAPELVEAKLEQLHQEPHELPEMALDMVLATASGSLLLEIKKKSSDFTEFSGLLARDTICPPEYFAEFWTILNRRNVNAPSVASTTVSAQAHVNPRPGPMKMTFVPIPAGSFRMGSENGDKDERPVHDVRITLDFELQQTQVTQKQWQAVMGDESSDPLCPVVGISWDDAQKFIATLNAHKDGYTYRLPTEAEWEYAAQAGTMGDEGGTGTLDKMGWYDGNADGIKHPVALKLPNAWGLYDMHGNVWEWVADWYGPYPEGHLTNPCGPSNGKWRVCRGGHWNSDPWTCRSAKRNASPPDTYWDSRGFRLARSKTN